MTEADPTAPVRAWQDRQISRAWAEHIGRSQDAVSQEARRERIYTRLLEASMPRARPIHITGLDR